MIFLLHIAAWSFTETYMEEAILQNATLVTTSVTPTLFDTNQAAPF